MLRSVFTCSLFCAAATLGIALYFTDTRQEVLALLVYFPIRWLALTILAKCQTQRIIDEISRRRRGVSREVTAAPRSHRA